MGQPKVEIEITGGNLGRVAKNTDGVAALICSGVGVAVALNTTLGPFVSMDDVEAAGITESYDSTNSVSAWAHAKEFFEEAGNGKELYMMLVAQTVTMATICDKAQSYAKKLLVDGAGEIKLLGVTRDPDGAYVPAYTGQLENDLTTAIANLKALIAEEAALYRPVSAIIEARNFQGNAGSLSDYRSASTGPNANRVNVVIGQSKFLHDHGAWSTKSGSVGKALGRAALNPVQRNIGRVKSGALIMDGAYMTNGALLATFTESQLDQINDKGFIFFRKHVGKAGFFFNDDHSAAPLTDDFSQLSLSRTIDKAARIAKTVYTEEILDDIELDPTTGKLDASTIKHFQGEIEKAINDDMLANGEITSVEAYVNPDQNVQSTSQIIVEINIRPKGYARTIKAKLAFKL